ncbi:hypothetical protein KAR91_77170 [Candidatus Pacearchaeota archaeon]|nr:hypothetical protein [Candidatus Pacearchaeota archaeon]
MALSDSEQGKSLIALHNIYAGDISHEAVIHRKSVIEKIEKFLTGRG